MDYTFLGILAYIVVSLLVGLWVSTKVRSEADYLVAGRSLGYGLATFSIFATWFGAETCIGASGAIYERGLAGVRADPFGYTLCLALMGLVFAVPLWRRGLTTLADLFRTRYSTGVERFAVLVMFPSSVLWAAAQIRAFGHVLTASSSAIPLETAITIAAGIVVVYTVTGGLMADAMTDLIQGLAMIVGLVVLLVVLLMNGEATSATEASSPIAPAESLSWLALLDEWAVPIFGSLVAQELVSRVLASRSPQVAGRGALMAAGIYLVVGAIPLYIGMAGARMYPGLESPEQIMPLVAQRHLPTLLYVLYAGALVSAILSTVDSALLAASALLSHNFIVSFRPTMGDAAKLRLARGGVVVLGGVAYVLAIYGKRTYEMVEDASAMGSAGVLVILTFGLFTRVGGPRSAMAALAAGTAVWFVGTYVQEFEGVFLISLAAATAIYLLSALIERPGVNQGASVGGGMAARSANPPSTNSDSPVM